MFNKLFNMKLLKKVSLLGSLILINPPRCYGQDVIKIGMRALVLSTEKPETVLSSLASYGIQYDNLIYNCENPLEGELYLLDETTKDPKYNMIILASGAMKTNCYGSVVSALSDDHWKALRNYESKYNIRRVTLNASPEDASEIGVQAYNDKIEKKSLLPIYASKNKFTNHLFNNAGILETAPFNTLGIRHDFAKINNSTISAPVLSYNIKSKKDGEAIAAVYSKLEDGNERLTFFLSSNGRNPTSLIINHLWIPWVSKYIYSGFRRIYLSQHIDDIFTSEKLIPVSDKFYNKNKFYKNTVADFDNLVRYQNEILTKMPAGSSYHLELVFNGNGILDDSSYNLDIEEDEGVSNNFIKPKGTGVCKWPEYPYPATWLESELDKNSLFNFFKEKYAHENFYWASHGFTHQSLNNATFTDVANQIEVNKKMALHLGISDKGIFSRHVIIPPHSSGLHNGDAIDAFIKNNIEVAFGNIHREDITNDESNEKAAYMAWRTTLESSNVDNYPVIPRIPTMLFRQCSTPSENTVKYNKMFEGTGLIASFDEILNRDTQQALLSLFQLRHYPFQFHQANLRSADLPNQKSLVEQWTEKLVEKYNQYVKWPIVSVKSDDIRTSFLEREKFENCDLTQQLIYNGTHIIAVSLTATNKSCRIPIALPNGISIVENDLFLLKDILTVEQVNESDPITLWVHLNNNSVALNFEPAIPWGEYKVNTRYGTLAKKSTTTEDDYYFDKESKTKGNYTAHDIITNVITNILKFNLESNKLRNELGYTSEQLRNVKALNELEKSRLYAEGSGKIQERRKKDKTIKKYLKDNKDAFYKAIEYNFE
ncbi:hypothetical protein BCR36DRAFT_580921 [Piromyces finnis]|uniref:Uncharacterized protein n=1 Tax=Piromyces finnis TaxID=1754191 RepID=A0A1Y1VJN2_9FUNG|nr:hypothetical protein BCR36DRAFT_580921 [Piromyces finnis]|eukprot:ORX56606.1 hypothetical protein BCR36DRAFT_580921 [Piromyces finnis]